MSKLREMCPNNQVDGIVIGYVDSETVKRLHYNDEDMDYRINHLNLESIIRKTIKNYLNENIL